MSTTESTAPPEGKRRVRMQVHMAGNSFNWQVDQEVIVEEELAIALCTLPEDGPRARPVGWSVEDVLDGKPSERGARRNKAVDPHA